MSIRGSKLFTEFIDARLAVVTCGSMILLVDTEHMILDSSIDASSGADPDYLVSRVGIPSNVTAIATTSDCVLLGTDGGVIYILSTPGRITRTIRTGLPETITCLKPVGQHSIILGTDKGSILIFDLISSSVKSSWKPSFPCRLTSLSVEAKGNWFTAVMVGGGKSRMVCGSTRTLLKVFESSPLDDDVKLCEFVTMAATGLSILAAGSRLTVLPLDLSTTGSSRTQNTEGSILDLSRCKRGDFVAVCASNKPIEILSAATLSVVHSLVIE